MWIQQVIFYIFAAIAVLAAGSVVLSNNPVRSALSLVLTFFAAAGIWLLAQAEFLALVLILVYVGAVMTLFLFVIMMLNIDIAAMKTNIRRRLPIGILLVGGLLFLMFLAIHPEHFGFAHLQQAQVHAVDYSSVKALGQLLYTSYAFAFELAAVILLVAIIAATVLVHRAPRACKTQRPNQQMRVRAQDRIELVDLKGEQS